ncbi:E3 SUMO-protein ligase ZBED1-like [Onthophagus taurus]|uniref:E3 SUMO-protein ligase ZBED1-like n=1 Tax=Onthophagus taurus TaxID=166361 RepID=UPI0039BDD0B8
MPRQTAKRSFVWDHFVRRGDISMCSECKREFKFFGNTTNLSEHLKRKHPALLLQKSKPSQDTSCEEIRGTLPSTSTTETSSQHSIIHPPPSKRKRQVALYGKTQTYSISENEQTEIDQSLVEMIVSDFQPLSIVENKGFMKYTNKLNGHYDLPSRKKITTSLILNIYTATLSKVKNELNLSSNLSTTTDIWTSSSTKAFLAVTAHYINGSQLNSYLLETKQLVDRHSAGNVASSLREVFESWDIFEKVHCIVTDNASNMRNAITVHLNKTHQPCIAHTLNLCTMDTLKHADLQQLLEKCKNIVGHFKRSTVASGELAKMHDQMKLPLLKVKQDVSTRWNSCLAMMQRLEELKVPLSAAMSNLPGSPSLLSSEDWALIKDCICILKPIEAMTSELSGEKYITLSIIIPLIRGVQHAVENAQPITSTGKILQTNFHDILLRRLGYVESSKICAKATLLDPRLKILAFDKVINGNQALKWITQEVEDLIVTITQHLETPNSEIPCTQGRVGKLLLLTHFR